MADDMNSQREEMISAVNNMSTGTYKASGDIFDFTLYDSNVMLSTRPSNSLFSVGVGGNSPAGVVKTLADTNLLGSNGMPQGWKLLIKNIKVMYTFHAAPTEAIMSAWYTFLRDTVLQFKITGKDNLGQWTLQEAFNISVGGITAAAAVGSILTQPKAFGMLPLNLPLVVASNVRFNVDVTDFGTQAASLDADVFKVGLAGILERLS